MHTIVLVLMMLQVGENGIMRIYNLLERRSLDTEPGCGCPDPNFDPLQTGRRAPGS